MSRKLQWGVLGCGGVIAALVLLGIIGALARRGAAPATPAPTVVAQLVAATPAPPPPTVANPTETPSAPTAEPTRTPIAERTEVTGAGADGVNLRGEPSISAERVKLLRDGDVLVTIGPSQQADGRVWRNVRADSDGAEGWIAAEFIGPLGASVAKPEVPAAAPKPVAKPAAPAGTGNSATGVAPASLTSCPASHPVKGNQGSRSNVDWIYHIPGGRSYGATQPERCFASATEAASAGYRAPER